MRLKHSLDYREKERRTTSKGLWEWLHSDSIVLPPGQLSIALRGPLGPMVSPVGKKRAQSGHLVHPAVEDTSWEVHSILESQGSLGASAGLCLWGSDSDGEEGVGSTATSTQVLVNNIHANSRTHSETLASSSGHLQSQAGGPEWPRPQLAILPDLGPWSRGHIGCRAWSIAPSGQEAKFAALLNCCQKPPNKEKSRTRWFHWWILPNI